MNDQQLSIGQYRAKYKWCPTNGSCHIDVSNRKACPNCRLKKCLALGMNDGGQRVPARGWRLHQDRCVYLTDSELKEIRTILAVHDDERQCFVQNVLSSDCVAQIANIGSLQPNVRMAVYMNNCYALLLRVFQKIPQLGQINHSQLSSMKGGLIGSFLLNWILRFNPATKSFDSHSSEIRAMLKSLSTDSSGHLEAFTLDDGFAAIYGTSTRNEVYRWLLPLLKLAPDNEIVHLLSLSSFLNSMETDSSRSSGSRKQNISSSRAYFLHLLKMYTRYKYGPWDCPDRYDQFIRLLDDVQETSCLLLTAPMRLIPTEVAEVNDIISKLRRVPIRHAPESSEKDEPVMDMKLFSSNAETVETMPSVV